MEAYLEEMREAQRARGPATVLAIGTANPSNCIYQSDFTDYYFCVTNSNHLPHLKAKLNRICVDAPGADHKLINLLGLNPSVKRFMLYQQGCYVGGTVLRLAKDLAENNAGAHVLVVCSKMTVVSFREPCKTQLDNMVGQALFADGTSAAIVGASPLPV
ncbi:hypothetical protein L6164_005550 [Bauhinia variegata]|uniref:Uncharacterized protein n=1 Tax=Bauhinia variegata TaxID=167791 RepID=A0ACB9PX31_BAUVA|nr:hypothetical protein L6164_005550 [Bauhinia variegata]